MVSELLQMTSQERERYLAELKPRCTLTSQQIAVVTGYSLTYVNNVWSGISKNEKILATILKHTTNE